MHTLKSLADPKTKKGSKTLGKGAKGKVIPTLVLMGDIPDEHRTGNGGSELLQLTAATNGDATQDADDDEELDGKEKACWILLDEGLRNCRVCGKSKWCKLSADAEHIQLSSVEMAAWARAMVSMSPFAMQFLDCLTSLAYQTIMVICQARDPNVTINKMPDIPLFDRWRISGKKSL